MCDGHKVSEKVTLSLGANDMCGLVRWACEKCGLARRESTRGRRAVLRECGRLLEAVRGGTAVEVCGCATVAASLSVERAFLKLGVEASGLGLLLMPPYIAMQLCGMVVVRVVSCIVERLSRLCRRWPETPIFDEAEMASEGTARFPQSTVAKVAVLDVVHVGMILGSAGAVPATLVMLLAHTALPSIDQTCLCWPFSAWLAFLTTSSNRSGQVAAGLGSNSRRWQDLARRCLAISAALLIVCPRLTIAAVAAARGHPGRARSMLRRLLASAVYALATAPAVLSASIKENALEEHAEPVALTQLNAALAAWQLAFALIALIALCFLLRPPAPVVSAAWAALFAPGDSPAAFLFVVHFCGGLAARLAPALTMTLNQSSGNRILLLDAARAASIPLGVLLLNLTIDPTLLGDKYLFVADLLATACVLAELAIGPGTPVVTFVTKQRPEDPTVANYLLQHNLQDDDFDQPHA